MFNFDNKYINTKGVSDEVRKASLDYYIRQPAPAATGRCTTTSCSASVRWTSDVLLECRHPQRMFCCEISSREMFDAYDARPIPWDCIMAYIRLSVDPRLQESSRSAACARRLTMTSITGSSDKVKNRATGGFATCATWCRNPI